MTIETSPADSRHSFPFHQVDMELEELHFAHAQVDVLAALGCAHNGEFSISAESLTYFAMGIRDRLSATQRALAGEVTP